MLCFPNLTSVMQKKLTNKQFDPSVYPEGWGLAIEHHIPETFLTKIGDFVVLFNMLEATTQDIIRLCLNQDERVVQIITAELSFKNLRALVISLFLEKGKDNEHYQEISELMKRAAFIEERRNQIIHGLWTAGPDNNHIMLGKVTAKEGKGLASKKHKIPLEVLNNGVLYLKQLVGDIAHFGHDYASATGQKSCIQFE